MYCVIYCCLGINGFWITGTAFLEMIYLSHLEAPSKRSTQLRNRSINRYPPPRAASSPGISPNAGDPGNGWKVQMRFYRGTWSSLVIGECGSVAEGSSASRSGEKRSVTACRRGGVTKGRGCSSDDARRSFSGRLFRFTIFPSRNLCCSTLCTGLIRLSYRGSAFEWVDTRRLSYS